MRPSHARLRSAPAIVLTGAISVALAAAPRAVGAQSSPAALIQRAIAAIGGETALKALANTTVDFNSTAFGIGQEETPMSPARATLSYGRIVTDYRGMRRATAQESRAVTGATPRQRRVIAGGLGMTETNGTQAPDAAPAVAAAMADIRLLPDRLLLAALETPTALSLARPRPFRGEMMDGVRYANGPDTLSLWFDRLNGRLVVAERVSDDGVLGDRRNTVMYTRWTDAGGVVLPREIDSEANGRLVAHTVITTASINAVLPDSLFTIPDSIVQRARRAAPPAAGIVVTLVDIGPNVWRAEGQSHHSLVVKQGNGLLVIEMPQTSARSRAVLDTLKSKFPGVAVRTAVNTHHHWDHSGGVREYLARGIPIVTHQRNVNFLREIAATKKSVAPDALSRGAGRAGVVRAATDTMSIGDGDSRVILIELPNTHVEGMLAAYVPALRVLFVADVIQPGPTMSPVGSREVVAMAKARGIIVDRVVGAHAGIVTWADVVAAAAR